MPAGLLQDQVVEVKVPNPQGGGPLSYGSGYLITPSLVLTAGHVVQGFQSADVVFSARQPDDPPRLHADIAWAGQKCDIVLLRVRWPGGSPPWEVTAARLGDVPRVSSDITIEGFGFPRSKDQELATGGHLRDGDRVPGLILAERNLKTGKLDLQLTADAGGAYGTWKGFSGAAVFAYGFLVGVVTDARVDAPRLTARRISVPAGACWALNPSFSEPDESVRRFRALLAEDGHDLRVSPARRRPGYMETIETLRPRGGLAGRAAELAELRAFVRPGTAEGDRPYADWVADAWAGKTALAAQFASDPPAGVDVVAFFASRTRIAQAEAFWKQACDQLAALLNEPAPLAPDEAKFTELWGRAGMEAEQNGRTLVLLIDGLDENYQPPPIAGAIPDNGDKTRRVIVFRREQPALKLRRGHPLADPRTCLRRTLARSSRADELREDAFALLEDFLKGERAGVLGVLAAAGPISARDIADVRRAEDTSLSTLDSDLLAAERVSPVLRDAVRLGLVWPLADDPGRFAFQHDTLLKLTSDQLEGAIRAHRNAIRRWADGYAAANWPAGTPSYLLVGYPALLADLGDAAGLAALAVPARGARLRASTGDDAATVDELASAVRLLAAGGADAQPDLAGACGVAFRRAQLLDALTRYPVALIEAHAALGHWQRAERIAAHQGWPAARVSGLTAVAAAAAAAGEVRRADQLFAAALHALTAIGDRDLQSGQRNALASAAAANARLIAPQSVRGDYSATGECAGALLDFAVAYSSAGLIEYAEQFMNETCGPGGPLAQAEATEAEMDRQPSGNTYGVPGNTSTDVVERRAAIQNTLNIISLVAAFGANVARAAARTGRLDTAVRVAAILPQHPNLLAVLGEACRTVTDATPESQLDRVFGEARAAADGLPDPVQRAAALAILAAAASGQLAADISVAARMAMAAITDPARQARVGDIVTAAATAGQTVPELISAAQAALADVADPALRAAALAFLTQTAAAAGQPAGDLIATAETTARRVADPGARALTTGTVAQAAAVAAQLAAVQSMALGTSDPTALRWLGGMRQAPPGDLSLIWTVLSNQWTNDATRAASLRDQMIAIAPSQLAGARSVAVILQGNAQPAEARAALARAAASPLVTRLSDAARQTAAGIPDPAARSWILGELARGFAACGLLAAARSIADDLPDAGQRAWTYGALAQATAAAGQPAAVLLKAARDFAVTVADQDRRGWLLGVIAETAAIAGEADVGRSVAAVMDDPGQRAWALGLSARAAAAAGQPTDDLISAARDAARGIGQRAQRASALAQAARDSALCAHPEIAAELLAEADQAALADDPVLRAALLAAIAQASTAQPERAALLFGQACRKADVPDPVQRAMALAEIARFAPGRPGWSEHIAAQAQQAAALTDPVQRSAALPFLVQAASRSGDDALALTIAGSITSPTGRLVAMLLLARSAAVHGDRPGAETRLQAAAGLRTQDGQDAPPWATAAIENTRAFCESLNAAKDKASTIAAGGFGGFSLRDDPVDRLIRTEATAVTPAESADALAIADAARGCHELDMSKLYAQKVRDPTRRSYLLAAIAEAELTTGRADDAAKTLTLLPPRATLADRSARGRLFAVSTAVTLAGSGAGPARAELADGLTDCFSPELVSALAALDPQAVERLAVELADAGDA